MTDQELEKMGRLHERIGALKYHVERAFKFGYDAGLRQPEESKFSTPNIIEYREAQWEHYIKDSSL